MADDTVQVLITFALDDELIEQIRAADPQRVAVEVLAPQQRQMLRGRYPSESERAAVAQGLHDAFDRAEVVFGFWGTELHYALIDARGTGGNVPIQTIRDAAPRLKWIQLTSAGADRLLNSGFVEQGITVTTVSGLHATPIGEFIVGAMLQWAKGAPRTMRAQLKHEWARFAPTELHGKTVGIVGIGHIGAEAARLAKAFGCRVIATKRSATVAETAEYCDEILPARDLPRVLAESDYVALCLPLTDETRGLIGEKELRLMKPSAFLVNIARGPVIVEQALIEALRTGVIAGAALDVFEQEPLPADSPLWEMDNVIVTPHISGGTEIYNARATAIFTDNLRRYLSGAPLRNVVDPSRGY
jgi:phosphoglycerate dehydrogenase-like enzyme